MDPLSVAIDAVRFQGRLYALVLAGAPWGLSAAPSHVATFHAVLRGGGLLQVGASTPVRVRQDDLVVICHGTAHSIRDREQTPTAPISQLLGGTRDSLSLRVGGAGTASTILCGGFFAERHDGPPLFSLLPPLLHVRAPPSRSFGPILALLAREAESNASGGSAILARLTEALFIEVVRAWSLQESSKSSAWFRALAEPSIAEALGVFHRAPAEDHSVASVARRVGLSRSAFAERFRAVVGEPPMQYLMRWRVYTASVLLRDTNLAVAEVASRVGYESEASLNKAFKRTTGRPPGAYRRNARKGEIFTSARA